MERNILHTTDDDVLGGTLRCDVGCCCDFDDERFNIFQMISYILPIKKEKENE